jgi:AhpC/TSA family protein
VIQKSLRIASLLLACAPVVQGADEARRTVLWGEVATEVDPAPDASPDLWVTTADLTRATGFALKPQGVCREELCVPIPKARKAEFLSGRSKVARFNLSAFARLLEQPVVFDATVRVWYFGPRPDQQGAVLASLQAPDFTLPDVEGKKHSLADFRGKKVLLVTWASW